MAEQSKDDCKRKKMNKKTDKKDKYVKTGLRAEIDTTLNKELITEKKVENGEYKTKDEQIKDVKEKSKEVKDDLKTDKRKNKKKQDGKINEEVKVKTEEYIKKRDRIKNNQNFEKKQETKKIKKETLKKKVKDEEDLSSEPIDKKARRKIDKINRKLARSEKKIKETKKIETVKKEEIETESGFIRITNENLNGVLLELKNDKTLLNMNILNTLIFLMKNLDNPAEILSKLKILYNVSGEDDIVDQIAKSIIYLVKDKLREKLIMFNYIMGLDIFSRIFCKWYFEHKELSYEDICLYSEKLLCVMNKICNLQDKEQTKDKEIVKTNEVKEEKEQISEDSLVDLEDSKEIERLNKGLGLLFKPSKELNKVQKQKMAKIFDTLDQIIKKNGLFKEEYYEEICKFIDIDDILYRKVWRVLRNCKFQDVLKKALCAYNNIWRNINFMWEFLGCQTVLCCACANENAIVEYLNLNLVRSDEVLEFVLENDCDMEVIDNLIFYSIRNSDNLDLLNKVKDRFAKQDDGTNLVEACNRKISQIEAQIK